VVLDGKGLPHTGSGTVGGNGAGGGVVIDRRAGSIVPEARGWLLGVIPGGRRRGRRVARIPIVGATCAGGARMSVPIGRRVTGSGAAVRPWRLSEPVECGKREGLVGGAAKDSTFGKSINPPHQSSVSAPRSSARIDYDARGVSPPAGERPLACTDRHLLTRHFQRSWMR